MVSIRSRHFQAGEPLYSAVKAVFGQVSIRSRHFQAGEQVGTSGGSLPFTVSIRSRHFQAGEHAVPQTNRTNKEVSIRSRHFQAGEHLEGRGCAGATWFQSAPAIFRRENRYCQQPNPSDNSFNPLPPFSGGRTLVALHLPLTSAGFNPLPPFSGGRTR